MVFTIESLGSRGEDLTFGVWDLGVKGAPRSARAQQPDQVVGKAHLLAHSIEAQIE